MPPLPYCCPYPYPYCTLTPSLPRAWHRANIKIDWTEELRRCKALEQRGEANAQLRRMTEVRTIDAGDRRVGLRGQKG